MNSKPLLSLCIPTNGIMDLVKPVIESIYANQVDEKLFEVIIMDNGDNEEFRSYALEVEKKHSNFHYYKTDKKGFLNEFESYKKANGEFIKFINHRTMLLEGALDYFINFVKDNKETKPAVYFSNGVLGKNNVKKCNSFNDYVYGLGLWNTWSTGMAFWKEDFDKLPLDQVNDLFPHTNILFGINDKKLYILDDTIHLYEIPVSAKNKGKYDLYYAFSVEFNNITTELLKKGLITKKTFKKIKKELFNFCISLFIAYNIRKEECSYIIDNYKASFSKYYSLFLFYFVINKMLIKTTIKRIINNGKKKK